MHPIKHINYHLAHNTNGIVLIRWTLRITLSRDPRQRTLLIISVYESAVFNIEILRFLDLNF